MRLIAAVLVTGVVVLFAPPAAVASQVASDSFNRADANTLGVADSGQKWAPLSLSSGQAWAIRGGKAAFVPAGNNFIRYVALDSGTTSADTMQVQADITFSPVSANVGLAINVSATDHVFCKTERTPYPGQPYGFMAIGGKFDNGSETSVLGSAKSTFSAGEQLRTGTTYHVVLARSGRLVTCTITGMNTDGSQVNESVSYTLLASQADGLTSRNAGLRMRYEINAGTSNEDDAGSRWDNFTVSDGTNVTPDLERPTAPTNVTASASPGRVDLSWTPSMDNVGVASYEVSRTAAGGSASVVGSSPATACTTVACSFTDATVAPTTAYSYSVVALDAARNRSDASAPVAVTSDALPATMTIERPVASGSDDAEEWANGTVNLTSSDLELTHDNSTTGDQIVGMRFSGLSVPPGATITNAYVQFEVDEVSTSTPVSLVIRGERSVDASTFKTTTRNISSRPGTAASVAWSPPPWPTIQVAGADQRTPNLASILQEIIGQTGWASGNAAVIVVSGTGKRTAESFNGTRAPVLHVEYATP